MSADADAAGVAPHASTFELPDATATATPAATALSTAATIASPAQSDAAHAPPSDMEITTGVAGFASAHAIACSTPSTMTDVKPEPSSSSTLTPYTLAPAATPIVLPPTVPAQCVPWPSTSVLSASAP